MRLLSSACLAAAALGVAAARRSGPSSRSLASIVGLSGGSSSSSNEDGGEQPQFVKIAEEISFAGKYRQIKRSSYRFPRGQIVDFDILTQHGQGSVVVVAWDTKTRTATLIREFHPGAGRMQYGTVAGMFEKHKHTSALECASMELEEEAHLGAPASRWIPLLAPGVTASFEKYSDNHFHAYLVLDPFTVPNPKPLDAEEFIIIESGVSHARCMELIRTGQINLVSGYALLLAFSKLAELGLPLSPPPPPSQ